MNKVCTSLLFISGFAIGLLCAPNKTKISESMPRVIVKRDTVHIDRPIPVYRRTIEHRTAIVARADTTNLSPDSASVILPIESNQYRGNGYSAWVSGWDAKLDSLHIEQISTTIPCTTKQQRLSFGIQGGLGLTPRGIQPYIGVGITIRLF